MRLSLPRRCLSSLSIVSLFVLFCVSVSQIGFTQDDVVHVVSGIVRHLDKDAKTVVVKADDGTEHTIKWTEKTTWEGVKDAGKGIKEGSRVGVKYTEKAGEKIAVGIKDLGKAAE